MKIEPVKKDNFERTASIARPRLIELMNLRTKYRANSRSIFVKTSTRKRYESVVGEIDKHLDWYIKKLLPKCTGWEITGNKLRGYMLHWLEK